MMMYVCAGQNNQRYMCFSSANAMTQVRRKWMRTWDVLDGKERTMDVIKGYGEVNDDVKNKTMR